MKETLYSQYELLALANRRWNQPERELAVREAGRQSQPCEQHPEQEPRLPDGYRHIRSAIRALMAAEAGLEDCPGQTDRNPIEALDRIKEAIAELRKGVVGRFRGQESDVASPSSEESNVRGALIAPYKTAVGSF
jgi:hypothetical protein